MGIYDRDYYQGPERGGYLDSGGGGQMMVTKLVIFTFAIFLVEIIFDKDTGFFRKWFALYQGIFYTNWKVWQPLTYGFLHSKGDISHVLFNMLFLWFLGRDVEAVYGRKRFLSFYLSTIIISGIIGSYFYFFTFGYSGPLVGASGGVTGVVALCIFHFPRKTILLWFVLPIPIWVLGVVYLASDFYGMLSSSDNVAYSAHLAGVACGWLFFKTGWDASRLLPSVETLKRFRKRPDVRIHNPDADGLADEVDRILAKINRDGESSLTKKERRTLERASRLYKKKQE